MTDMDRIKRNTLLSVILFIFLMIILLFAYSCRGKDPPKSYELADEQDIQEEAHDEENEINENIKDTDEPAYEETQEIGYPPESFDDAVPPAENNSEAANVPAGENIPSEDIKPLPEDTQDDTAAKYEYFLEGGKYICKGCYLPFNDISSLNDHVCTPVETKTCSHDWVSEYSDIWVEEKGHYEEGVVREAYDEPVYEEMCVCRKCGLYFHTSEEAASHIITEHENEGSWTVENVITSYVHHDEEYGNVFIVDEEAHWEKIIYRYRCSICGEFKYPD